MITLRRNLAHDAFDLTDDQWILVQNFTETLVTSHLIGPPHLGLSKSECIAFAAEIQNSQPLDGPNNMALCRFLARCHGFTVEAS